MGLELQVLTLPEGLALLSGTGKVCIEVLGLKESTEGPGWSGEGKPLP